MPGPSSAELRDPYLPSASSLQASADAVLVSWNQHRLASVSLTLVGLVGVSLLLPDNHCLEILGNVATPLACLALVVASVPGAIPAQISGHLLFIYACSSLGSYRIAFARYVEFHDASALELGLRVGLCILFAAAFTMMGSSCLYLGSNHWRLLRLGLGACNAVRLAVVLTLSWAVEPRPSSYPPDLPFVPALMNTLLWIVISTTLTPSRREHFSSLTGANKVLLRLDEIKWLKYTMKTRDVPRSARSSYIEQLERRVDELSEHNRLAKHEARQARHDMENVMRARSSAHASASASRITS